MQRQWWYRLAADQAHAKSQWRIGGCYEKDTGVAQDVAEAVRWFRLAADQDDARAQFNIGVCYMYGTGVVQDNAEALRWLRLAADQGYADAETVVTQLAQFDL
jgi:TPR repeat protein